MQTELQAWEALSGEIALQASANLNAKASFQTVLAAVAAELDLLAEDPDLIEMFDLIVSLGGKGSVYLQEIKDWGARFVDQKKRRMRLAGFKVLNGNYTRRMSQSQSRRLGPDEHPKFSDVRRSSTGGTRRRPGGRSGGHLHCRKVRCRKHRCFFVQLGQDS